MSVPSSLFEALGRLVSEAADARDVFPDDAAAFEYLRDGLFELYAGVEGGCFGPITQGIEAGTDETAQQARPEGQEPGPEGMRP